MPEQTESTSGAGDQQVRQPTAALPTPEQQVQGTPAQMKPTTRPAGKTKTPTDDRDDFIRNAVPVAAALRRSGKPDEAKQLELVASAILQTKSLERTPAPEQQQATGKEESIKDLLASVYKAIDQDPALKNMPEAKEMRRASNKLDKDGMLNITVRNGVVTSFFSNFTDNLSRTNKVAAPQERPVVAPAAPTPEVVAPAPVVEAPAPSVVAAPAPADDQQLKVATIQLTYNNPEELGRGMPDVLSKRFQDAGASAEVLSTKPAMVAGQSVSEVKVSYRLDAPGIDKVSALLDAAAIMRGSKLQEMPGDQQARKDAAQQQGQVQTQRPVQHPTYTLFAPSTENGIIDSRKAIPQDGPQFNVAMSDKGEFGINPKVDQKRLIGDGIESMSQFFDYALPTSGFKIAHVGLAEPGQMKQTEKGWEVVTKGKLAITDTDGNVFKPQVSPAQQVAPTAIAAPVQQPATAFSQADIPTELLAKMGVPVAELERTGQLQKLLDGKKTDLIQGFTVPNQTGEPTQFAAKLVLDRDAQGVVTLRVDLPKRELEIPQQVMGKEITPAMQEQLKRTGLVPLTEGFRDNKGQPFAGYLAVDQEMKRVVAVRPEGLNVPEMVYGVKLSPDQHKLLLEGKSARIEGMTHPKEKQLVDASVHLDPLARKLVFRDTHLRVTQEQTQTPAQQPPRRQGVRM